MTAQPDPHTVFEAELARLRAGNIVPLHPSLGDDQVVLEVDDPWNLIDWTQFWTQDHNAEEWLIEPIIAAERGHAIIAKGGTGKSLFALWMAVNAATGNGCFHGPMPAIGVLYLDYEMTADDLAERLAAIGIKEGDPLDQLHYSLLPATPPLDTDQGGLALATLASQLDVKLVVIDTYARAVAGDENEADTVRAFYRATATHLKRMGIALLRIDHLGKDTTKGARGSSAKNDDVDIVWQLEARDHDQFVLKATKRRTNWVPETITLLKFEDPALRYTITDGAGWPAGTLAVAAELDAFDIPTDASRRQAADLYRAAGGTARNTVLNAAAKYRQSLTTTLDVNGRNTPRNESGERSGNATPKTAFPTGQGTPGTNTRNPRSQDGNAPGNAGEQGPEASVPHMCVPKKGTHKEQPTPTEPPEPEPEGLF
jgi:hypothetical protein